MEGRGICKSISFLPIVVLFSSFSRSSLLFEPKKRQQTWIVTSTDFKNLDVEVR